MSNNGNFAPLVASRDGSFVTFLTPCIAVPYNPTSNDSNVQLFQSWQNTVTKSFFVYSGAGAWVQVTSGTGGDTFKIQPRSAFDGSLGAAYKITRSWLVGLYWYGQINQYNYSFTNGNTGLATSGSQNVFYSNGELRIGHDF